MVSPHISIVRKRRLEYIYFKRYWEKSVNRIVNKVSGKKILSAWYWNAITVSMIDFISKILHGMKWKPEKLFESFCRKHYNGKNYQKNSIIWKLKKRMNKSSIFDSFVDSRWNYNNCINDFVINSKLIK